MAELRTLLLGPAEAQIAEVHARLTDPRRQLEEVSHVLPAAIAVRSRQDDELLMPWRQPSPLPCNSLFARILNHSPMRSSLSLDRQYERPSPPR